MRKMEEGRQLSAVAWLVLAAAFIVMAGQFAVAKHGLSAGLTAYDIVALRFLGDAIPAAAILVRRGPKVWAAWAMVAVPSSHSSPEALTRFSYMSRFGSRPRPMVRCSFLA
jgi:hypothetical protein